MNLRVKVGVFILCMAVMLGFSGCGNSSDKANNTSVKDSQENEGSKEEANNKESSNKGEGNDGASSGAVNGGNNADKSSAPSTEEGMLSEDRIKELVLEDANIRPKDAFFIKVRLEKEKGVSVYDVEFYVGDKEYDYTVDPVSGEILEREVERE